MAIPHKCEICGGSGQIPTDGSVTNTHNICQGCGGSGIVWEYAIEISPAGGAVTVPLNEMPPWTNT